VVVIGFVCDGIMVLLSFLLNMIFVIYNFVSVDYYMMVLIEFDWGDELVEFMKDYVGFDYYNDGYIYIDVLCYVVY